MERKVAEGRLWALARVQHGGGVSLLWGSCLGSRDAL